MEISVHFLGCDEQVDHLPYGKLEIHLLEEAQLPQKLVSFSGSTQATRPINEET